MEYFEKLKKDENKYKRILDLYEYLDFEVSDENISNDIEHDYLTENVGRDGKEYFWYFDENKSAAIEIATGNIITDNDIIDGLFC